MTPRAALVWTLAGTVALAGCALPQKKWGSGALGGSLAGAAVGAGAGVGVGAGIGNEKAYKLGRDAAIGAAIGLVIGGAVGHYVFDEDLAPPPPAAPPVAPPPEPAAVEPLGDVIAVVDVSRFGFNEWEVPPSSHAALDALAAKLNERQELRLVLEGHTDSIGSEEYNDELGLRRAEAVIAYLASHGVDAARMSARSKGMSVPVASNDTPEGRAKNRRVEVRSQGGPAVAPSEGAAPEAVEPEVVEPEAVEPEVVEPEAVEPEAVEPEPVEPEAAEPEAAEPAAAEPEAPAGENPVLLAPAPEVQADAGGRAERVVYFTPAQSLDLDPGTIQVLDNVVDFLLADPAATVVVIGQIDGVVEINRATATIRAERVKAYMVNRGVAPERVTMRSEVAVAGDTAGDDEATLARRRRAVLQVSSGQ